CPGLPGRLAVQPRGSAGGGPVSRWYTDPTTRCTAEHTSPYRGPIQCTRDTGHTGAHESLYTKTVWSRSFDTETPDNNVVFTPLAEAMRRHPAGKGRQ